MRHNITTGLSDAQERYLIDQAAVLIRWDPRRKLTLEQAVILTLQALRQNCSQQLLAYFYRLNQSTVSRIITTISAALNTIVSGWELEPAELGTTAHLLDGTLIPTGQRSGHPELYSGKRKNSGVSLHVVTTVAGDLRAVSTPVPGSVHDLTAFRQSELYNVLNNPNTIADLGYQGSDMTLPYKKPTKYELTGNDKKANRALSTIRVRVEHAIRHLKQWKTLSSGYRAPLHALPAVIRLITALERYRITTKHNYA